MNFDYFCVEYPILLSCVDGIGFGFSCDFLEFLLNRVLDEGIQDVNAGALYQGIVRDLIGRQEMVKNIAVGEVLEASRAKCVAYLRRRWVGVKAQGGFKDLDKEVLRTMAEGELSFGQGGRTSCATVTKGNMASTGPASLMLMDLLQVAMCE
jgi:hypothetical protein